jgi:hypothetical protein
VGCAPWGLRMLVAYACRSVGRMWIPLLAKARWVTFALATFLVVAGIVLIDIDPSGRVGWVTAGIGVGAIMIQRYINLEAKKLGDDANNPRS